MNLQFQNGKKYSDGWIYAVEDPNGMSGTFWLADSTGQQTKGTAGALQISYLNYTNNGSSITYFITRAAVTGSGGSDYDNPVNPPKGPYIENYSLTDCKMSIGGKNYAKS